MHYNDLTTPDPKAIIIAEAGINHDGDIEKALRMIDVAAEAGADYVKFQSFQAQKLVTPDALTSSYIKEGSNEGESFEDLLRRLQLSPEDHVTLKEYCDKQGIKFLSTAFDEESFDFLLQFDPGVVKVASGDLTNLPFLATIAKAGLPMIVSTGMASLGEIEDAVKTIENEGNQQIVLLHCISWYPAAIDTTNLRYLKTLEMAFPYPVGYSDHTLGITMPIAARALGATVLEKHFTLDKTDFGPDHAASIEPDELIAMVRSVREVEEGLGTSSRQFGDKEIGQRDVHRRSIVMANDLDVGTVIGKDHLAIKRPGTGIPPKDMDKVIGKKITRAYKKDELLDFNDLAS